MQSFCASTAHTTRICLSYPHDLLFILFHRMTWHANKFPPEQLNSIDKKCWSDSRMMMPIYYFVCFQIEIRLLLCIALFSLCFARVCVCILFFFFIAVNLMTSHDRLISQVNKWFTKDTKESSVQLSWQNPRSMCVAFDHSDDASVCSIFSNESSNISRILFDKKNEQKNPPENKI